MSAGKKEHSYNSGLTSNPFYQNGLILDLLAWGLLEKEEASAKFQDPLLKAEELERTGLRAPRYWSREYSGQVPEEIQEKLEVSERRVSYWQKEYERSEAPTALRWPHTVFPPLPYA